MGAIFDTLLHLLPGWRRFAGELSQRSIGFPMLRDLYGELSTLVQAYHNCAASGDSESMGKHEERLTWLIDNYLPRFEHGPKLDLNASCEDKLVFHTAVEHMDNLGGEELIKHTILVVPSRACGVHVSIAGRNFNNINYYIHNRFYLALIQPWDRETNTPMKSSQAS